MRLDLKRVEAIKASNPDEFAKKIEEVMKDSDNFTTSFHGEPMVWKNPDDGKDYLVQMVTHWG